MEKRKCLDCEYARPKIKLNESCVVCTENDIEETVNVEKEHFCPMWKKKEEPPKMKAEEFAYEDGDRTYLCHNIPTQNISVTEIKNATFNRKITITKRAFKNKAEFEDWCKTRSFN